MEVPPSGLCLPWWHGFYRLYVIRWLSSMSSLDAPLTLCLKFWPICSSGLLFVDKRTWCGWTTCLRISWRPNATFLCRLAADFHSMQELYHYIFFVICWTCLWCYPVDFVFFCTFRSSCWNFIWRGFLGSPSPQDGPSGEHAIRGCWATAHVQAQKESPSCTVP